MCRLSLQVFRVSYRGGDATLCYQAGWWLRGISLVGSEARQQCVSFRCGDYLVFGWLTSCGSDSK